MKRSSEFISSMNEGHNSHLDGGTSDYFRKLVNKKHSKKRAARQRRPPPPVHVSNDREATEQPERPQTRSFVRDSAQPPPNKKMMIIADLDSLRPQSCQNCSSSPLDLSNVAPQSDQMYLHVICKGCQHVNPINLFSSYSEGEPCQRGRKKNPIARNAVLGCIHQGLGHSHYKGLMSAIGILPVSSNTFKRAEREVGKAIEDTAKESCTKWLEKEKEKSNGAGMRASFDQGWQRQARAHNSRTGQGTLVGMETKKCIDYGTRNTYCRICLESNKKGVEVREHDCRRNHQGSSKAMEGAVAVELFKKDNYTVLIGDDDSTVICKLREEVNSSIEKWSDINHATCTMAKALYEGRGQDFGPNNDKITDKVIDHLKLCFSYAVHQNGNDPEGMSKAISSIVPHCFGDHSSCGQWCRHKGDQNLHRHASLPGGRDLEGAGLRKFLADVMNPFTREEVVKKLAPLGSSQINECINSIVGTKNPKKRFYGGSESSDFRTAAAVAQYNEGYSYLEAVNQKVNKVQNPILTTYVNKMQKKREKSKKTKQKPSTKKRRNELKKMRKTRQTRKEGKEGTTYRSGIGLERITQQDVQELAVSDKKTQVENVLGEIQCKPAKPQTTKNLHLSKPQVFIYDLETTGLRKDAEIVQLSCVLLHNTDEGYTRYVLPNCPIDKSAAKVTGLSVGYASGQRALYKDRRLVKAVDDINTALQGFCTYIANHSNGKPCVLIAHNGNSFDAPRLTKAMASSGVEAIIQSELYLGDSLPAIKQFLGRKHHLKLVDVYEEAFSREFPAHDALEDCKALGSIIEHYGEPLIKSILEKVKPVSYHTQTRNMQIEIAQVKESYKGKLNCKAATDRLSKLGISFHILKDLYERCGERPLVSYMAAKWRDMSELRTILV